MRHCVVVGLAEIMTSINDRTGNIMGKGGNAALSQYFLPKVILAMFYLLS